MNLLKAYKTKFMRSVLIVSNSRLQCLVDNKNSGKISFINHSFNVSVCTGSNLFKRTYATSNEKNKELVQVKVINKEDNNAQTKTVTASPIRRLLKVKDLVDFIFLCFIGFGIYYGYSRYKETKKNEEKNEIEWLTLPFYKSRQFKCKDYYFPDIFAKSMTKIKEFKPDKGDIWVASFPKSGTTWLQEIVYLIQNDCDFEKAASKPIDERIPFLEYPMPGVTHIQNMKERPRILKTHLPLSFLPDGVDKDCKMIYIIRNPKDVVVSYYHFTKSIQQAGYTGGFSDFLDLFMNGQALYGPWWKHVDEYSNNPNILVIYYEDLHNKPAEIIKKIGSYLNKELTDKKIDSIIKWCSFDSMKQNKAVNYEWFKEMGIFTKDANFYRKGKIGDWLTHFECEKSMEFDELIEKNLKSKHNFDYGISKDDLNKIYQVKANKPN